MAPVAEPPKPAATWGGTADDSSRGSSSSRRELKRVPAIARPTLPPSCWNRVRLLVAVPICRGATAPCTTRVKIENIGPTPRPVMNIHDQRTGSGVSADRERDGSAEREQLVPAGARDDLAGR